MKLRRKVRESPIPYVPMADMAFNLLIFFLVLAKAQQDTLTWDRAASPGTKAMLNSKVVVTVDKANKVYLNGSLISVNSLEGDLNYLFGNGPADKRTVVLRINKDAPAAIFEPVLEAAGKAGAEVFHVLAEER